MKSTERLQNVDSLTVTINPPACDVSSTAVIFMPPDLKNLDTLTTGRGTAEAVTCISRWDDGLY